MQQKKDGQVDYLAVERGKTDHDLDGLEEFTERLEQHGKRE